MPIVASFSGGREFQKVPAGIHFAVCNLIADLGMQRTEFSGQVKDQRKVYIRWEVPDIRVTYTRDGQTVEGPATIGATYTLSLSDKANLRKVLESWRGVAFTSDELKRFDITTVAGKPCQIMVTHSASAGKSYANVTSVVACSREQKERARAARPESGVLVYELDNPSPAVFAQLPPWIREKIEQRIGAQQPSTVIAGGNDDDSGDIPF